MNAPFVLQVFKTSVSLDMLGRIFNGSGKPIDNGPPILHGAYFYVSGELFFIVNNFKSCVFLLHTLVNTDWLMASHSLEGFEIHGIIHFWKLITM